jgi:hypothetical protein
MCKALGSNPCTSKRFSGIRVDRIVFGGPREEAYLPCFYLFGVGGLREY